MLFSLVVMVLPKSPDLVSVVVFLKVMSPDILVEVLVSVFGLISSYTLWVPSFAVSNADFPTCRTFLKAFITGRPCPGERLGTEVPVGGGFSEVVAIGWFSEVVADFPTCRNLSLAFLKALKTGRRCPGERLGTEVPVGEGFSEVVVIAFSISSTTLVGMG